MKALKFIFFCSTICVFLSFNYNRSIIGKWIDRDKKFWLFNKDGSFMYQGESRYKPFVGRFKMINKDSLLLQYGERQEIIKVLELNTARLVLGISPVDGNIYYPPGKVFTGDIVGIEEGKKRVNVLKKGKLFLEGNILEADVNDIHIKCDSVLEAFHTLVYLYKVSIERKELPFF